jgi:hypothetical protein
MQIADVVSRRTDLSTFLVHLCRDGAGQTAKQRLLSILSQQRLSALNPFGPAVAQLIAEGIPTVSQNCVCFSETPLEHVHLLIGPIEDRQCQFEPYGVAITKKQGRRMGVNPIWYQDITPGHGWLSPSVEHLIEIAIATGDFPGSDIARLTPFIEQMGTGQNAVGVGGYRKEFWWEREWRHVGDFLLPPKVIALCPVGEILEIKAVIESLPNQEARILEPVFIDPRWGLEKIIGRLAGFAMNDLGPF